MLRHRIVQLATSTLVLALLASASCGGSNADPTPPDVRGTWDVYWTLSGSPEHGPSATNWRYLSADGSPGLDGRLSMDVLCSEYVLPTVNIAGIGGTITGDSIALVSDAGRWSGTVTGDTMTGTFVDPRGVGTWRAVRVTETRCATYEVWGGTTDLGCGSTAGYAPDLHGYVLLGTATKTRTFEGAYPWYYVLTRGRNVARIDTVETTAGTYVGTGSTGNAGDYLAIGGPPDGVACAIGTGGVSGGGYVRIAAPTPPPSITVHVLP